MTSSDSCAVNAFDMRYTQNHIQILKVLLPYFDPASQGNIAVWIKYMELQYTMQCAGQKSALGAACFPSQGAKNPDVTEIFEQIKNFCTPQERAMFGQISNLKRNMEMFEEMKGMMQLFEQLAPEGTGNAGNSGNAGGAGNAGDSGTAGDSPLDLLRGLLSPEQQALFESFQSSFSSPNP